MSKQYFNETYGLKPSENYERFFVPVISRPMANDLLYLAALRPGERVVDVACGTGIVARLAAQQVGADGAVVGVDLNPGMLDVARSNTPPNLSIEWQEASAAQMPLADETFDVVLCQLSLQFMPDKVAALKEMRRLLLPGGRLCFNLPGPAGKLFAVLAKVMEQSISPQAAGFIKQVFSLHDTTELQELLQEAGFQNITLQAKDRVLSLPPAKDFLWQYIYSTPLAGVITQADEESLATLEREALEAWQAFEEDGSLRYQQRIVQALARK